MNSEYDKKLMQYKANTIKRKYIIEWIYYKANKMQIQYNTKWIWYKMKMNEWMNEYDKKLIW